MPTQNSADKFSVYFGTTGLTLTTTLSKAGGPFLSVAPTVTDSGNGYYIITPLAAHRDTLGKNSWLFDSGTDKRPFVEDITVAIVVPSVTDISNEIERAGSLLALTKASADEAARPSDVSPTIEFTPTINPTQIDSSSIDAIAIAVAEYSTQTTTWKTKLSTAEKTFSRAEPTRDYLGRDVPPNVARKGETSLVAGRAKWESTGLQIAASGTASIQAVGKDVTGTTTIVTAWGAAATELRIYQGDPLTFVRAVSLAQLRLALNAPTTHTYTSIYTLVHHGAIIAFLERTVASQVRGVTVAISQDLGLTWTYVPVQGVIPSSTVSVGDVPDVPVTGADTISGLLRDWSIATFPVAGIEDRLGAWITWVDYQNKSGNPGGYQTGLFKLTRSTVADTWTVQNNRLIYQTELSGETGFHGHGSAICSAGLLSALGDVGYRNRFDVHAFDLANYTTAPITSTIGWHGSSDFTATKYHTSFQPTSPTPAADGGSFWSGDETHGLLFHVADIKNPNDPPKVRVIDRQPKHFATYQTTGSNPGGWAPLSMRWCQSANKNTWVNGSSDGSPTQISVDGENFARTHIADSANSQTAVGRILSDESYLYRSTAGTIFRSTLPEMRVASPIQLSPGGTNLLSSFWSTRVASNASNVWNEVRHNGRVWVYVSSGLPLSIQPPVQPLSNAPCFEVVAAGTSTTGGEFHVTPTVTADRLDFARFNLLTMAVCPLGPESTIWEARLKNLVSSFQVGEIMRHEANDTDRWTLWPFRMHMNAAINNSRGLIEFLIRQSGSPSQCRFLVQPVVWNSAPVENLQPSYPRLRTDEVASTNEVLTVLLKTGKANWSVAVAWREPSHSSSSIGEKPICSWKLSTTDRIDLVEIPTDSLAATYVVRLFQNNVLTNSLSVANPQRLQRGDTATAILSYDETKLIFTVGTFVDVQSAELAANISAGPTECKFDGCSLDLIAVAGSDQSLTASQQLVELQTLSMLDNTTIENPTTDELIEQIERTGGLLALTKASADEAARPSDVSPTIEFNPTINPTEIDPNARFKLAADQPDYAPAKAGDVMRVDGLGSGSAFVAQPVSVDGEIESPIVRGDTYRAIHNRQFAWTVDPIGSVDVNDLDCELKFSGKCSSSVVVDGTVTITTVDGAPKWLASFDLLRDQSLALQVGKGTFSMSILVATSDPAEVLTKVMGDVEIVDR